jgi:hypothetical protein
MSDVPTWNPESTSPDLVNRDPRLSALLESLQIRQQISQLFGGHVLVE